MSFIKLSQKKNGLTVLVNLEKVTSIIEKNTYSTVCFDELNDFIDVEENIETIKERIGLK
jgi:hypothetical protein